MNYKLKHLAKYCCTPETELEFETVKMAAELGGVDWYNENEFNDTIDYPFLWIDSKDVLIFYLDADGRQLISVLDFINKLRMTEEEAKKLEDDRVKFMFTINFDFADSDKALKALNGHYFKTNADGTEVTLHKR